MTKIINIAILFFMLSINTTFAKTHDLVEILELDPSLKLDIRYATKNNFLKRPVYKSSKAFLQKEVAKELIKINSELKKEGYVLLIFDGYRPWSVTKIFWDETPPEKRNFVADPKKGSIHNRGCAVDLSLYDLKRKKEVKMPCEYDEFSERAYPDYSGGNSSERKMRDYLINKMQESKLFTVNPYEWWHYDYKGCEKYPILDLSFEEIK